MLVCLSVYHPRARVRVCVCARVFQARFFFLSLFDEAGSASLTLILVKIRIVRAFLLGNQ